jgi:multiple sugar transport system permease protein
MLNSKARGWRRFFNVSTLTFRLWNFSGTALLNLFMLIAIAAYLSPLSYMVATALKTNEQLGDSAAPILPARAITFSYQGKEYPVYEVPTADGLKQWALVKSFRLESDFVDPDNPGAGLIHWEGSWRSLDKAYTPSITFENFVTLWNSLDYPRYLRNSLIVVGLAELGVLCASIAVAYGFARFRIPGGKFLFMLCIATIMIPDSITLVPSFVIYTRVLGWNGSFLPLIVPQFFGSAIYIFLLRQNFKTIPREMDEAAMLDGAGPLRTLISIILPQSIPVVVTVALLQFFNMWNEMRMTTLYLSTRQDLWTMPYTAQAFITFGFTAEMLQASALILMIIPVIVLFVAQRFFMQDMVVTGIEK